jgi:hypothetical protein
MHAGELKGLSGRRIAGGGPGLAQFESAKSGHPTGPGFSTAGRSTTGHSELSKVLVRIDPIENAGANRAFGFALYPEAYSGTVQRSPGFLGPRRLNIP